MITQFQNGWQNGLWRMSLAGTILVGFAVASLSPYRAIIGIERLGLTELEFAIYSMMSAGVTVIASMIVGIYTDQTGRFKDVLMGSLIIGTINNALLFLLPSKWMFIAAMVIGFPLAMTAFTQFFALAKLAANTDRKLDADFSSTVVRAAFAGAYAVTPPLWAALILRGTDLLAIFGVSAVSYAVMLVLVHFKWPAEHQRAKTQGNTVAFGAALNDLTNAHLAMRLFLVSAAGSLNHVSNMLFGLIILNDLDGSEVEVGVFAGLIALIEIPVMLLGAAALRYVSRAVLIFIGVVIYALHMVAFQFLPSLDYLFFLVIPAGVGGGLFLATTLAYVQELVTDKPGTGGALIALYNTIGQVLAAMVFGICTLFTGYSETAIVGAALSVLTALALILADRRDTRA